MPLCLTISVLMSVPYSNTRFTSPGSVANILFIRTSGKDILFSKNAIEYDPKIETSS